MSCVLSEKYHLNLLCRYLEGCQCTVIIDLLARSPTVTVALLHIDLMLHIPGQGLKLSKYSKLVIYFSWRTIKILQNILIIRLYVNIFKVTTKWLKIMFQTQSFQGNVWWFGFLLCLIESHLVWESLLHLL